ncbi:MAG TPA: hypothetical protein VK858_05515 [Longimicrobiales bacterium]|nr:hypothetical protein [Longimicrobiales bacterium]
MENRIGGTIDELSGVGLADIELRDEDEEWDSDEIDEEEWEEDDDDWEDDEEDDDDWDDDEEEEDWEEYEDGDDELEVRHGRPLDWD